MAKHTFRFAARAISVNTNNDEIFSEYYEKLNLI
jgi:hypothetical protein